MNKTLILTALLCLGSLVGASQPDNSINARAHARAARQKVARNVVLMIGDGMGSEHVWAAWLYNGSRLNITTLPVTGFSITSSASHGVTDSAAGGTAIACGCKAINGQLGLDAEGRAVESLAARMRKAGKATGIVVTKSVTDATPAAFYAHVKSRKDTPAIAAALVDAGFDVVAGGGADDFTEEQRAELEKKTRMLELAAPGECEAPDKRGDWMPRQVEKALRVLETDKDGFFLMVEGSKIDMEAHSKDLKGVIQETLDFDQAVGVVLEWMKKHPDTLLVVTADHQTGGLSITNANRETGMVTGKFSTYRHSGVAVPVYAAGVGAERFTGVRENTDLAPKIYQAAGMKP
ncbi:MAG: alkaline phosphatase [Akkermansia sp.]|nr:alkaline phosphatase [Akkermansia sp.]